MVKNGEKNDYMLLGALDMKGYSTVLVVALHTHPISLPTIDAV